MVLAIQEITLDSLTRGNPLTFPVSLTKRGVGIAVSSSALADTGAGGYVFIDPAFARDLSRTLGVKPQRLPRPIVPSSYDGSPGTEIKEYLLLDLELDGRHIYNLPLMILGLGSNDLIIGRNFLEYFHILVDSFNRKLIWPPEFPKVHQFHRSITLTRAGIKPKPIDWQVQRDVIRREEAIERDAKRRRDGVQIKTIRVPPQRSQAVPSEPPSNPENARMPPTPPPSPPPRTPTLVKVDIKMVSANGFALSLKRPETQLFSISLDGLDRLIADKKAELESPVEEYDSVEELRKKVPAYLHPDLDFFSKRESDTLPPHRPNSDHKIELLNKEDANSLGFSHLRNQTPEELMAMRDYLAANLAKGFIKLSRAPFGAPILFARKGDGSLRFCVDYRKLNQYTKKNRYPLPLIDETLTRLARAKVYTKLDVRQAFHRIRMDPESEELTAFRTRYGLFQYRVLPFGLTNGPATFQSHINEALQDLLDVICTAYLDDILIFSEDELAHEGHVKQVIDRLRAAGLQADIKKCEFGVKKTKYLGFIIGVDGVQVDPEKIQVVASWQYPRTVKGVQSFLGFCNFYRRFIRNYSQIAVPLTRLTRKDHQFIFSPECVEAFEELRRRLLSAPLLAHYDTDHQCLLETDASDTVIAAVFSQKGVDREWHPVAYFSKTIALAEINYPIHDKELLAIVRSLEHWRAELEGSPHDIQVVTDHKALEYFMTTKSLSARQARWAEILSRYRFKITYAPGKLNRADPLTRRHDTEESAQALVKKDYRQQVMLPPHNIDPRLAPGLEVNAITLAVIEPPADLIDAVVTANLEDPTLGSTREAAANGKPKGYRLDNKGLLLKGDRLWVPESHRTLVIEAAHCPIAFAHPGKGKTGKLLRRRYFWPQMDEDIARFVANCHACRRSKVPRDKTPGLLHPLPKPDRPWQHISVDFKSMPPDKEGNNTVCVFVCRFSKRPISIPCKKEVDAKVLAGLYMSHVHRYFGPATTIVSDRGPQFISAFWREFCHALGTKLKLSTPYHPQTDGQTENANQWIDQRLRPFVGAFQDDWSELIHIIDYAAATLPQDSTGFSSFEVEFGYQPRSPIDWERPAEQIDVPKNIQAAQKDARSHISRIHQVWKWCHEAIAKSQERQSKQANKYRRPVDWDVGDKVWVSTKHWKSDRPSRKLGYQNEGPYEVVKRIGHSFRLKLPGDSERHEDVPAEYLRRDPDNPLPGQHQEPPLPITYNTEPEWEVEKVLHSRRFRRRLQYQVKWEGLDHDPTYYNADNFKHAPQAIRTFHEEYPKAIGPPANLSYWIDCYLKDEEPEDRPDDNSLEPQS
ncbi:MAG: reverse transcriptase domain-containing protein [Thaumarchaeota archaeon]|nr:reverse transcriptase domain-containing protein [Nitrososphaerota archaeon]